MSRTPNPKKALVDECRSLLAKLHRKHKPREWGGLQLKDLDYETLDEIKESLLAEVQKQSIITQIRELTPGKRNGKALESFTLEQLNIHLSKLKGESAPQIPLVASPVPRGEEKPSSPTPSSLTLNFSSIEALSAFCERIR